MKEWLLLTFAKAEHDLLKLENIFQSSSQGKRSFGEYVSTLQLALKQCKVQTPDQHTLKGFTVDGHEGQLKNICW